MALRNLHMNILMIDDDPQIVDQVELLFSMRWPEVSFTSASEGKRGIQMAEIVNPDLIILDLGLPDMDGLEALRDIRKFSQVPIMVFTIRTQEIIQARAMKLGANDYVVKPFAPNDFLSKARTLAEGS